MKPDVEIYFSDLGTLHGQYTQEVNDFAFRTLKEISNHIEQKLFDFNSFIDHKSKLYTRVN
jgi:fructose/tagatose bisphosphate aldolase